MSVLKELLAKRDKSFEKLQRLTSAVTKDGEDRVLTEKEEKRSQKLLRKIDKLDGRLAKEAKREQRERKLAQARQLVRSTEPKTEAEVTHEPMVYGEGSRHSYYADLARRAWAPLTGHDGGAAERLAAYEHQVEREVAQRSKFGLRAEREYREINRKALGPAVQQAIEELRARGRVAQELKVETRAGITTGGGATASASGGGGAAFVTPAFYVSEYAPYREYGRAFVDQCNKQPLPDYGMEVYIPQVTGPAEIAAQTEGHEVAEKDVTAGYISGGLITQAGDTIVSQQLLDRAGPNFAFDRLIFDQLNRDYAPKTDTYAIKEVLAVAKKQEWEGREKAFALTYKGGAGGFFGQVNKAIASIRETEGTVLNPTHLFMIPGRWELIAAWSDEQARPVVLPNYAGVFEAVANAGSGDAGIEGRTGATMSGLPVYTDANIPRQGTTQRDQAIVGDLAEVYWYEGTPVTRVIPQTYAQNLQVLLQMYAYQTIIVRFPNGVVYITGEGLSTITYTD